MPILLNSEIHFERFTEIDQAIIGRINEMCNYDYLISIKPDINKNYRLIRRWRYIYKWRLYGWYERIS